MYLWYIVHHSINSLEKETPLSSPGEATAKEQLTNCFSKRRSTDHKEFKGISALAVNNFIVKNFYKISKCLYWSEGFEGFQISRFERFQANIHSVINPLKPGYYWNVTHTWTNLQLKAAGLFEHVWHFSGH